MIKLKDLNDTGEKIPELGIGTWKMGVNPEKEAEALKTAIRLGMRFIDTAEMYATEWIVANAIKNQKKIFLATTRKRAKSVKTARLPSPRRNNAPLKRFLHLIF
jgi:diketogulonate reductase-like aldo/keto reductase